MIVGTDYGCATTTANRIYGLGASSGAILWIFNGTASYQMDAVHGLAIDTARNTVYATSLKPGASSQNTAWAIRTTNGSKRWGADLGSSETEPRLAADGLFVAVRAGTLYKLHPATGSTDWARSLTSTSLLTTEMAVDVTGGQRVAYVPDSGGTLHAVLDNCASASPSWDFKPAGAGVTAAPAILNDVEHLLYVGADDGRIWQVRPVDGIGQAWATISAAGSAPTYDPVVFADGASSRLLANSGGVVKKLCVPWADTPGDKARMELPSELDREWIARSTQPAANGHIDLAMAKRRDLPAAIMVSKKRGRR